MSNVQVKRTLSWSDSFRRRNVEGVVADIETQRAAANLAGFHKTEFGMRYEREDEAAIRREVKPHNGTVDHNACRNRRCAKLAIHADVRRAKLECGIFGGEIFRRAGFVNEVPARVEP